MDTFKKKKKLLRDQRQKAIRAIKDNFDSNIQNNMSINSTVQFVIERPVMLFTFMDTVSTLVLSKEHKLNQVFERIRPFTNLIIGNK